MTILNSTAIDITKVKTRWEEAYVSEAINRALSTMPKGIYHGFVLTPDGGTIVRLSKDDLNNESKIVVEDRAIGGKFVYVENVEVTFDLTAFNGQTVYIFAYVNYSIGASTVAEYRVVDAAELANPWVASASLIGTVRVPAAGAITAPNIEQSSAELAGLSGAENSRWTSLNSNPVFRNGLAGWAVSDEKTYLAMSGGDVRLGDISGAQPVASQVGIRKFLPNSGFKVGDYVHVRVRARSSNVLNGAVLKLTWGNQWNHTIISTNASALDYGFIHQITGAETGSQGRISISADLTAGANATGYFFIEQVEIYVLRMSGHIEDSEVSVPFNQVSFGDAVEDFTASIEVESGSQTIQFIQRSLANEYQFPLTEDNERTLAGDMYSLVGATNAGVRSALAQDEMFPFAYFSGGTGLSKTDVSAQLTIDDTLCKGTSAPLSSLDGSRFVTVTGSVVTVPVSGGVGVDQFFVAADPATNTHVAFLEADLSSHQDKILLLWGEYDNNTSLFKGRVSVADIATDLMNSIPITVGSAGSGARYSDLAGVLHLIAAGGFLGPKEIHLIPTPSTRLYSHSASNPSRRDLPVTSGTRIRGIGQPYLAVYSLTTTLFNIIGEDVVIEGIDILAAAGTVGATAIYALNADGYLVVKNCFFDSDWERCINASIGTTVNGAPGRLIIENSVFGCTATGICVNILGGSYSIRDSVFNGDEVNNGIAINDSVGCTFGTIQGCQFLPQSGAQVFDCQSLTIEGCESQTPFTLSSTSQRISNTLFDFKFLTGTDLTALAVTGPRVLVDNVKIINPTGVAGAGARGITVSQNGVTLNNVIIDITNGTGIRLTAASLNMSNIEIVMAGSEALRRGIALSSNSNNISNVRISGCPDNLAIEFTGSSDYNNLGFYVVDQTTAGAAGYTNSGTGVNNNFLTSTGQVI